MQKLIKKDGSILRVLQSRDGKSLVIDCIKRMMPRWVAEAELDCCTNCTEAELWKLSNLNARELTDKERKTAHQRFTMIAGVLPFVGDEAKRSQVIQMLSDTKGQCKQTIRKYLCLYLAYQDISILAPQSKIEKTELTQDEKNIRWALNKFFYTQQKNSLTTAYTMMLQAKYCDAEGKLMESYPTFHQFRYFYRKTKKLQTYFISRNGIKDYQKNNRPLLGDGVQSYAPNLGVGMLDATVCDIYLVDDGGNLVGRPILTACVDAFSGLCCGYALSWEGGTYSLRGLMLNTIADKKEYCRKLGISIQDEDWPCCQLPGTMVTDKGSEFVSDTFSQLAELGVTLVDLPSYRPELKGRVEKFFDLVQRSFKSQLKGKGVIEPDFQERGAHDYRKDACLSMNQFERIIVHCILYYNTHRIQESFPYTEEMVASGMKPYASSIWNYGLRQPGCNLISITSEKLILTLLPRTLGKFGRNGLKVNKLRYRHDSYTERFLTGGTATVAYNPEDVSWVWLVEDGKYTRFELIESRFSGKALSAVQGIQVGQRSLVGAAENENTQAKIDLVAHIQAIAVTVGKPTDTQLKSIRQTRQREQNRVHRDFVKEVSV